MNKVTTKNIERCWYEKRPLGWVVRVRVVSKGQSGIIRFGEFETKEEAKEFFRELKNS